MMKKAWLFVAGACLFAVLAGCGVPVSTGMDTQHPSVSSSAEGTAPAEPPSQKEGSIPMILNGSWALGAYMDSDEQSQEVYNSEGANHKIFLMDWNNDGKIAPVEEAVDVSLAINNQSKVKDAAWTFVDWMIHEGADTLVNGQLQYMPARNDMELNVEGLNENGTENLEYCVEQGKNNVGGYREMAYAELKETISNELTELALGDVTPEEAAETIEAASQAQER